MTILNRTTFEVMGTVVSLATPAPDIQDMCSVVREVLEAADRRFSPFRPDSELSRLQRDAREASTMSDEMREVLTDCLSLQQRTDGAFRPTNRRGQVDTTGYVKGWAMAQAEQALRERGWTNWNLGVGGDVVVAGHTVTAGSGSPRRSPPVALPLCSPPRAAGPVRVRAWESGGSGAARAGGWTPTGTSESAATWWWPATTVIGPGTSRCATPPCVERSLRCWRSVTRRSRRPVSMSEAATSGAAHISPEVGPSRWWAPSYRSDREGR